MLKGKMTIELTDVNTGEKETIEEENMVTNALSEIFRPLGHLMNADSIYNQFNSYYTKLLGGLLLFDNNIEEDPNQLYAPANANLVGCAVYNTQNNTTGKMRGGYNQTESEFNAKNRYMKFVYDFSTSQANGTISCVALTHQCAGYAVYPEIKCLGTAGPGVKNEDYDFAWADYRSKIQENPAYVYAVDEHYYVKPEWLYENVDFYDDYPRDIAVFAGEYAAHDANQSNSLEAALAEAAMMTGMEINGDVVKLASYAPLFNRIGHSQWTPDMIWFDDQDVILTPTYYVQKMFSDYAGSELIDLEGQEKELRKSGLYTSLVKSGEYRILKVVNAADTEQILPLTNGNGDPIMCQAKIVQLTAKSGKALVPVPTAIGTKIPGEKALLVGEMSNLEICQKRGPEEVLFEKVDIDFKGELTLPAKSMTVLIL